MVCSTFGCLWWLQELQQRLEGAAALCRATSAAAAAAAAIVSPRPPESLHGDDEAGRMPAAGTTAAAAGLAFLQQEKRLPPLPLVDVETPLPSSEAQLESLKRQIERLRENLGAFTEGLLQAHESETNAHRGCSFGIGEGLSHTPVRVVHLIFCPHKSVIMRRLMHTCYLPVKVPVAAFACCCRAPASPAASRRRCEA